jgi:hypothetical protein
LSSERSRRGEGKKRGAEAAGFLGSGFGLGSGQAIHHIYISWPSPNLYLFLLSGPTFFVLRRNILAENPGHPHLLNPDHPIK